MLCNFHISTVEYRTGRERLKIALSFYPWSLKVEPWVNRWTFSPPPSSPPPSSPPSLSSHHQIFVSLSYRKCHGGVHGSLAVYAILIIKLWQTAGLNSHQLDVRPARCDFSHRGDSDWHGNLVPRIQKRSTDAVQWWRWHQLRINAIYNITCMCTVVGHS